MTAVHVWEANGLGTGTATVESGVKLITDAGQADPFTGATIRLNGGSEIEYTPNNATHTVGGTIIANGGTSKIDLRNNKKMDTVITFEKLDFGTGSSPQLDVAEEQRGSDDLQTARFVDSVIHNSGTLNITDDAQTAVELDTVGIVAGATVTQIGQGDLNISTEIRTELAGSADMLFSTAFNLVDNTGGGTGSLTDVTAIFDNTAGLWNLDSAGGGTNLISVSLVPGASQGTIAVGGSTTFTEAGSGFVEVTGLTAATDYFIDLDLASLSTTIGDVVDELANNPAYSNVAALDADTVRITFTPTVTGTGNMAWDNVNSLGANVTGVSVSLTTGGGDTTPPNWVATWPQVDEVTSTGATARGQIDEDGTAYYVVVADGSGLPSSAQVKAGQNSSGSAAIANGSMALTASIEGTDAISGLSADTDYDVYFVAEDDEASPNIQATPALVEIATETIYGDWLGGFDFSGFTSPDLTPSGNPDSDVSNNLLEFAFGTNPAVSSGASLNPDGSANGLPVPVASGGGGGGVSFDYLFVRRDDHGTSGSVTYTPQFSSDLVTFHDSAAPPVLVADSTEDPDYEIVKVPYPAILPDGKKARFARMKVDEVP
ncbi:MAG: hypothetical protein ACPG4K_09455 [Haloferula sp.]